MTEFFLALFVFLLAHVIPTRPGVRRAATEAIGERSYIVGYSVMSTGLLAWLIFAAWRAPSEQVWDPAPWQAGLALVLVPLGFVLFIAGSLTRNILSVTFRAGADSSAGAVLALTRHPVLWGLALWALAHTVANGDLVGIVLFGTLAAFAMLGTLIVDKRKKRLLGAERWAELAEGTANLPFIGMVSGGRRPRFDAPLAIAIAATAIVVLLLLVVPGHQWLFGMDPVFWWVER
ncbi:MAG: NnrU family protein [Hyphomicrobiales bacterium]|nr:MAG: NnrU family protein [Hyphomicrobiales bacterium]